MIHHFSCGLLSLFFLAMVVPASGQTKEPLRVGVIGLVHTHVHWILGRPEQGDIEIVGIVEANRALAERYAQQHGYSMDLVYSSIDEMLEQAKPEAVTAFNTIYGHLEVVEKCAPRGIHVMVEKPLAVSLEHAQKMAELARQYNIQLLTNYETTWYGSNQEAKQLLEKEAAVFGPIRKIVVHDGHPGPIEIGCNEEFLEWLTDPKWNGAGALTDFGCYGANLTTWLMNGERPESVMAVTQQIKPELYPNVDDEATIVLTYPQAQAIIQASWNWNYNRKDMEVYCKQGYIICPNRDELSIMRTEKEGKKSVQAKPLEKPFDDPFALLEAVVRGKIQLPSYDLSSLENNLIVMEILEAAKVSAKDGVRVFLKE
ncbi:MAG TPA: Gfo/Idh/MocA family oxidoreductase [Saprospiraceae bacterium]|nr:Gfo/Idh/MocA family oxidoreductase [Saprospiraceae bacterium]HMQ82403.1 Gfo/Idh/MocA family oxidoreductase [Saprospiraceae bacterium]